MCIYAFTPFDTVAQVQNIYYQGKKYLLFIWYYFVQVTDARDGQSRTIRQFQFIEWPEQVRIFQYE